MAAWEESLAVRDGVFAQMALLTALLVFIYYAAAPGWRKWLRVIGVLLFVVLFSITAVHLWQPA